MTNLTIFITFVAIGALTSMLCRMLFPKYPCLPELKLPSYEFDGADGSIIRRTINDRPFQSLEDVYPLEGRTNYVCQSVSCSPRENGNWLIEATFQKVAA